MKTHWKVWVVIESNGQLCSSDSFNVTSDPDQNDLDVLERLENRLLIKPVDNEYDWDDLEVHRR